MARTMSKLGKQVLRLGLPFILIVASRSQGVLFVSTGDPAYNSTAPGGLLTKSGWQYEGHWLGYLATPVAPRFFIAARHIGGNIGSTFIWNGVVYHTVASFDGSNTDLRLWQVAETFPRYAPLYSNSDEVGKRGIVFGTGTDRGSAVIVGRRTSGWEWGSTNGVQRWGENVVTKTVTDSKVGALLAMAFNRQGGRNECTLSLGDSSGALFIKEQGTWKLAGIHYAVDGPFSRDGTSSTEFQAALVDLRGLYYPSGPGTWTLVPTNYPITFPSSFYSSRISANLSWIQSVLSHVPPLELEIDSAPSATNALATTGNIAVVKPGDTIEFTVSASSTNSYPVGCRWNFGDGGSSTDCQPSHAFTSCGPYPVAVTLTDGVTSVTVGLTVAAACPMEITRLKLQARFARDGRDMCTVTGTLPGLPADVPLANALVMLDVGDAQADFQLNANGRDANSNGRVKLIYKKQAGVWTFTGKLKGSLRDSWTKYGITSDIVLSSQIKLPVVLAIQSDSVKSFEMDPLLNYSNKSGSSGTATYP